MRNPEKVLNSLKDHSSNKDYKFERLYKLLYNEDLYAIAYQNIYANEGNMTKGTDGQTIDGMNLAKIQILIEAMKNESYQPNPSRRTYIAKKNSTKKRPLGIPSFCDKLVQEVLRMILEAIYEGSFEPTSHGFRPNRSCHTALLQTRDKFTGVKWFVEGDIKSFFDNIDHNILVKILGKRIKDDRFIRLIRKFLNAGYIEDWTYRPTHSGTPQGGIVSPVLSNIYLDELDKFMKEYEKSFERGKERKRNPEYRKLEVQRGNNVRRLKSCDNETQKVELIQAIREIEKARNLVPYGIAMDGEYKRLKYVRYADDFLVGIIGSKEDCAKVKQDIKEFLTDKLNLELSEEKTLITHAEKPAHFLGYNVRIRKSNLPKRDVMGRLKRDYVGRVVLEVTSDKIKAKLIEYGAVKMTYHKENEVWKPTARYSLKDNDDLEILDKYNSEIRGFYNYFSIANNSSIINSFKYIMEYSMYKTYATKYRTKKSTIIEKFRIDKDFGVKFKTKSGKEHTRLFYNEGFKRKDVARNADCDLCPDSKVHLGGTSLINRLKAKTCEYCNATGVPLEMHHVRKLKTLKGKNYWEALMIARNRKTIALCVPCHKKLHCGKLD